MIFQWESESATAYLKQLFSDETIARIKEKNPNFSYMDLFSIGNGAIRPAGESYRDKLSRGIYQIYDNDALNEFMKPTLGFCVFQEQVINFLHYFCGYTMGQADIVRRGFAKKTGTEKFIPDIKNGFIKCMREKYGVTEEKAENLIVSFLKVIEDASDYLFSKNHADPYSWIGYICGYLRYYYPLEFITVALNIFESKEDKSIAIINYAKKHGIKISPVKFRHSIAEYSCDKETNEIFKGLSSIKFMNATVANELYELRNNRYDSFIDLLIDMRNKTSINSRQITILIKLEFFSEFGAINNLLETQRIFSEFCGKKQFNKEKIISFGMHEDIIRKYSGNETEKMFTQVDVVGWLREECENLNVKPTGIYDVAKYQLECLGYIDYTNENASGIAMVTDVDTKYSPRLAMYSLKNGNTVNCKIEKRKFSNYKLKKGDIVKIISTSYKHKKKKVEGEWIETDELELWINKYNIIY